MKQRTCSLQFVERLVRTQMTSQYGIPQGAHSWCSHSEKTRIGAVTGLKFNHQGLRVGFRTFTKDLGERCHLDPRKRLAMEIFRPTTFSISDSSQLRS